MFSHNLKIILCVLDSFYKNERNEVESLSETKQNTSVFNVDFIALIIKVALSIHQGGFTYVF